MNFVYIRVSANEQYDAESKENQSHQSTSHSHLSVVCKQVSKGLPDWKNFVDFCNEIVVDGLVQLVLQSLDWLSNILDPQKESVSSLPMLEIKVGFGPTL